MKPESRPRAQGKPSREPYLNLGIPEEWVEPLLDLGYDSVDKLKAEENPAAGQFLSWPLACLPRGSVPVHRIICPENNGIVPSAPDRALGPAFPWHSYMSTAISE